MLTTRHDEQRDVHADSEAGGAAAGAEGNGATDLVIVDGCGSEGATYNATTNTLTATVDITGGNDTVTHLASVISAGADFATCGCDKRYRYVDCHEHRCGHAHRWPRRR